MRPPITSIETFHRLLAACRLPRVIVTAPELSLFTAMGSGSWSIQKLAQALDVSERGVDILCRNLAMCGLLRKRGKAYRNTPFSATVLNAKHPKYRGAHVELLQSHWVDWSRLTRVVRTGSPLERDQPDLLAYRRRFTAMHHRSLDVAKEIAATHRARKRLPYLPPNFMDEALAGSV